MVFVRNFKPEPAPAWITCIPSGRHPELVRDFATRLAERLKLPLEEALVSTRNQPQQKTMEDSTQQALNLDNAFALASKPMPDHIV